MAKIGTNANCITGWPNLEPILVPTPGGQILNYCKWNHIQLPKFGTNVSSILFSWRDNSSYRLYTLGPLCLWQCFSSFSENFDLFGFSEFFWGFLCGVLGYIPEKYLYLMKWLYFLEKNQCSNVQAGPTPARRAFC